MSIFINVLALLASLFGAVLIGYLLYGLQGNHFSDGKGMAILVFQWYGLIGAGVGFVLSLIGLFVGKKKAAGCQWIGKLALILSILAVLSLGAASVFNL